MSILDQEYTTQTGGTAVADHSSTTWLAQGITQGLDGAIDQVSIYVKRDGNGGNDCRISIYSNDAASPGGNDPDARISDETAIDCSAVDTSYEWKTYAITGCPSLSIGDKVHIVIERNGDVDATNHLTWGQDGSGSYAGGVYNYSSDGGSWSSILTIDCDFKSYIESSTEIKTINGLAKASIKTINGLAIADVKTFNGLE